MIIDSHAHACGEYLNIESIKKKMKNNGIEKIILVPGELGSKKTYNLKDYTHKKPYKDVLIKTNKITRVIITLTGMKKKIPAGNDYVYSLVKELPDTIIQFFWITKAQINELDQRYDEMKFHGVKLHQCWEYFKIESNFFNNIANWVIEKDLPLFIHLYSHNDVMDLIEFVRKKKEIRIVIGHLFGLELFMREDKEIFDNIYFDISNSYFVSRERVEKAIGHFGCNKIIMGSDTPYGINSVEKMIERINNLHISSNEKEAILSKNIKKLLSI